MATLHYRIRIRNAADNADDLVVSSVRGGTNPYLEAAPSGDGQEVDPITGAVRTGAYQVRIVDVITSGTTRLVTSKLFDSAGRQQMLSRRAYIELSADGGSTWPTVLIAGYISNYRLTTAITWEITISDTRRVEQSRIVFDGTSPTFAKRGCITGGPIVGGGWGPVNDRGGWTFKVVYIDTSLVSGAKIVWYQFWDGYRGINDTKYGKTKFADLLGQVAKSWDNWVNQAAQSYYVPNVPGVGAQGFGTLDPVTLKPATGLTAYISELAGGTTGGLFVPGATFGPGTASSVTGLMQAQYAADTMAHLQLIWPAGVTAPTVGDFHHVSIYTTRVSDQSPVYLTEHPVDLATKLWTDASVPYDATAAAAVRALLGDNLRVSMRVTQSQTLLEFLEQKVFGFFGIAARTTTSGQLQLFTTRLKTTSTPAVTIGTNDLQNGTTVIFDNAEASVISRVRHKTEVYWAYQAGADDSNTRPLDSVSVAPCEVVSVNTDANAYVTKEVLFEMQGMIHEVSGLVTDPYQYAAGVAAEMFDRYGRGAPSGELAVVRPSDTGFQIGDEIYLQPAHIPNLNKRYGDDPSVGARIMQVVRRTEGAPGPVIKVIDAGSAQQPVTPAAVISIAASGDQQRSVAQFTVTNAAAINAAVVLVTAIEWATGSSSPTGSGTLFTRYAAGACPTGAIQLPSVIPGSKVWVRARTEQDGRRPAAWTAWVGVTLTAMSAPGTIAFPVIRQNAVTVTWVNANATDAVALSVYLGGSAPADWTPYLLALLPAGTTKYVIRNLNGPAVTYTVGLAHRDATTGRDGSVASASVTTNSTLDAAMRPAGLDVITGSASGNDLVGIALALYISDVTTDVVIERAPDSGGSPGTYVVLTTVPGTTEVWLDATALFGVTYWYRIKAVLSGCTDSAYVGPHVATAATVPRNLSRPPATAPSVDVQVSESAGVGTVTLVIVDPQFRVDTVEFRTKVDPGAWSGWAVDSTIPYTQTVTIPVGSGLWGWVGYRVYGFDGNGVEQYLTIGQEQFDLNTTADMAAVSGTFTQDGGCVLAFSADTDTASFKYAISPSGQPTAATVRATSAINARNYSALAAGPYNIGATLYVTVLCYTDVSGGGAESLVFEYRFVREGTDVRVQEKCSESTNVGTVSLIVTDPNSRVSSVEARTMVGRGAWSAYAAMTLDSPNNYHQDVTLIEKVPSKINWRIIGTSLTGQASVGLFENVVTFSMGPIPMEPTVAASVRADGTVDVSVIGDSDTASIQVGFSTVSQATANAALGSTQNARVYAFQNVGTLILGQKGYVAVKAWSTTGAAGYGSVVAEIQVQRFNVADTIKSRVTAADGFHAETQTTRFGRGIANYASGPEASSLIGYHYGLFLVPRGVTLRALRFQGYCAASADAIYANFYRTTAAAGSTLLGSTQSLVGGGTWTTLEVTSLSEDTTDRAYVVQVEVVWNAYPGPPSSILLGYLEAEYDKSAVNQNI